MRGFRAYCRLLVPMSSLRLYHHATVLLNVGLIHTAPSRTVLKSSSKAGHRSSSLKSTREAPATSRRGSDRAGASICLSDPYRLFRIFDIVLTMVPLASSSLTAHT
jgi:hypothetical protein